MKWRSYHEKTAYRHHWHRWFAWRPVELNAAGQTVWLEYVERRICLVDEYGPPLYEYRETTKDVNG